MLIRRLFFWRSNWLGCHVGYFDLESLLSLIQILICNFLLLQYLARQIIHFIILWLRRLIPFLRYMDDQFVLIVQYSEFIHSLLHRLITNFNSWALNDHFFHIWSSQILWRCHRFIPEWRRLISCCQSYRKTNLSFLAMNRFIENLWWVTWFYLNLSWVRLPISNLWELLLKILVTLLKEIRFCNTHLILRGCDIRRRALRQRMLRLNLFVRPFCKGTVIASCWL